MSHAHHHHDDEVNAYYLDQLFTIGVCGALGGVAVMLWWSNRLAMILHPKFFPWVLGGGIALLVLVAIRAVTLWISVGEEQRLAAHAHGHAHHDHDHGPCHDHGLCGHDHGHEHHVTPASQVGGVAPAPGVLGLAPTPTVATDPLLEHGHSHGGDDHGHEHGWAPWRYVVLLLPVVLFFLGLPDAAISTQAVDESGNVDASGVKATAGKDGKIYTNITFSQLETAAMSPEARNHYTGKMVQLMGVFTGNDDSRFTLTRPKISCCAADAVPLRAVILVDYSAFKDQKYQALDPARLQNRWVQVTGQVQFLNRRGTNEYLTALIVTPTPEQPVSELVQQMARPPANPYAY
jgi:hypothetical protein